MEVQKAMIASERALETTLGTAMQALEKAKQPMEKVMEAMVQEIFDEKTDAFWKGEQLSVIKYHQAFIIPQPYSKFAEHLKYAEHLKLCPATAVIPFPGKFGKTSSSTMQVCHCSKPVDHQ